MTNGEKIKAILKPRTDQIRIYSDWVEIEIQSLSINFSCELSWWNAEYKEPTTKNDLAVEKIIDEIEKEFEKVDIPIMDKLTLFAKVQNSLYKCAELRNSEIPTGSTTKNDLGADCISRADAIHAVSEALKRTFVEYEDIANKVIGKLPSVTPQLSSGLDKNSKKLEKNFGELDCIDRAELLKAMDTWDKFGYTETGCFVREPKGDYVPYVKYDDMVNCVKGMPSVIPQEPILDKLRAEILKISSYEGFELGGVKDGYRIAIVNVLDIIDKYKAGSEDKE